jgi:hypothetical protein
MELYIKESNLRKREKEYVSEYKSIISETLNINILIRELSGNST